MSEAKTSPLKQLEIDRAAETGRLARVMEQFVNKAEEDIERLEDRWRAFNQDVLNTSRKLIDSSVTQLREPIDEQLKAQYLVLGKVTKKVEALQDRLEVKNLEERLYSATKQFESHLDKTIETMEEKASGRIKEHFKVIDSYENSTRWLVWTMSLAFLLGAAVVMVTMQYVM